MSLRKEDKKKRLEKFEGISETYHDKIMIKHDRFQNVTSEKRVFLQESQE